MSLNLFYAGSRITADELNALGPGTVVRSSTQAVTSSTTLVNDDTLFLNLLADSQYLILAALFYTGGTQGSSDMQYTFAMPSGASGYQSSQRLTPGGTATGYDAALWTGTLGAATQGTGQVMNVSIMGTVTVSSGGVMQLKWAQNTSSGTPTTMQVGSALAAIQVA